MQQISSCPSLSAEETSPVDPNSAITELVIPRSVTMGMDLHSRYDGAVRTHVAFDGLSGAALSRRSFNRSLSVQGGVYPTRFSRQWGLDIRHLVQLGPKKADLGSELGGCPEIGTPRSTSLFVAFGITSRFVSFAFLCYTLESGARP